MVVLRASTAAGYEPWISNGTPGGTTMLKDINPGIGHSSPSQFTTLHGHLYFTARSGLIHDLWTSDGTSGGTYKLQDGPIQSGSMSAIGGNLFFTAFNYQTF